jgi:hypothetical protein
MLIGAHFSSDIFLWSSEATFGISQIYKGAATPISAAQPATIIITVPGATVDAGQSKSR